LDHTLWDFDKNTSEAITEIYQLFKFAKWAIKMEDFIKYFHETNNYLWNRFNHGLIDRLELRNSRFKLILANFNVKENQVPPEIGDAYLKIAPSKRNVIPFTYDVLEYLRPNYKLHIISNGFDDVQHRKLKAAGIFDFFEEIITSDSSGHRKPQKEIFEYALNRAGANRHNALFVGDNLDTDIQGALNAQLDHIFFNPLKQKHGFPVTYEINCLSQIMNIL
jgi:putative hydrolase of the HAD superfamily